MPTPMGAELNDGGKFEIRPEGRSLLLWIYDDDLTSLADPKALGPDQLTRRNQVELVLLRAHLQAALVEVEAKLGEGGWSWSNSSAGF